MDDIEQACASLRIQIAATEAQLADLRLRLSETERAAAAIRTHAPNAKLLTGTCENSKWPLLAEEYRRYGRQMIVPQLGIHGQLKLRSSSVLIIGAGGLGCPAALYLAGAGVGTIGLVDGDTVEQSNLHRQILHRTRNVGKLKVDSAIEYLEELNPHSTYVAHRAHLTSKDAPEIFGRYDLILDCTDNPATRYLISDTAVLLKKPLVSASALRTEGQLMVLNYPPQPAGYPDGGPCYRCVFPKPPPASSVMSCADGGILGPVVGTMGVLQALEAIRILSVKPSSTDSASAPSRESPSLLLFSACSSPPFRSIRLRARRAKCAACSADASITLQSITSGCTDYELFCGSVGSLSLLSPQERISPQDFQIKLSTSPQRTKAQTQPTHILLDVREKVQFEICSLENSINIPISKILSSPEPRSSAGSTELLNETPSWLPPDLFSADSTSPIYVVCRSGNDSQVAVQKLKELGLDRGGKRFIGDIRGGLRAWKAEIDPEWPEY